MVEILGNNDFFIDDLGKIRILNTEVIVHANKLKDESLNFTIKMKEFKKSTDEFIKIFEEMSQQVEIERIKVIGVRNLLQSIAKERDEQKQRMQALIIEKSMALQRLRIEYNSLKEIELQQLETIEHLTVN